MEVEEKIKPVRPLSHKIIIQTLKTVLIRIPVFIIALVIIVLITARLYLNAERTEKLAVTVFNSITTGTLSLNVREFNIFYGFKIENILIKNSKQFENSKLLEVKKLVLDYSLLKIFTGVVRIGELGIYSPRIYIEEKNGVWSFSKLMKEGKPEKKKKPAQKEKDEPGSDEISLPINVSAYAKIILDDLRVYAKSSKFEASAESISLSVEADIPPVKKIPLSVKAATLLKTLNVSLNPRENVSMVFKSKDASASPELILTMNVGYNKTESKFASTLKFGTYKTPVRFKNTHLAPLNFILSYDLNYNPYNDQITLGHFTVNFAGKNWLKLSGTVSNASKNMYLNLAVTESNIVLDDFYPYYFSLSKNKKTSFRGRISLFPMTISGSVSDILISGKLAVPVVYFKTENLETNIQNISLIFDARKTNANMKIKLGLTVPRFNYTLAGSASGANGLSINTDIDSFNSFSDITVNSFDLKYFDPDTKVNAVELFLKSKVSLKNGTSGSLNIEKLIFIKDALAPMVTDRVEKQVLKIPLKKPIYLTLNSDFNMAGDIITAGFNFIVKSPDFSINDATLSGNIHFAKKEKRLSLKNIFFGSIEKKAEIRAAGFIDLKTKPISNSDIKIAMKLDAPNEKSFGEWKLSGKAEINASMKGDLKTGKATGNIIMNNINVQNPSRKIAVTGVELDFPFEYLFKRKDASESMLTISKSRIIDSDLFKDKINFRIKSVKAKHPARDLSFEYLTNLRASMYFKENVFQIPFLKANLIAGTLLSKNILFNLSDFKTENMEFSIAADITNMNIGLIDDPVAMLKSEEALLSLNANFSGRGVNINKELTAKGYIHIFKVGEKFANSLMKGLSVEKGKSKLGSAQFALDNTMNIESFNFNLDKGLVYTTVLLTKKSLGVIIAVEEDKVEFDRIPIQEYLRKVSKGD